MQIIKKIGGFQGLRDGRERERERERGSPGDFQGSENTGNDTATMDTLLCIWPNAYAVQHIEKPYNEL
jgi:hypothetical protein